MLAPYFENICVHMFFTFNATWTLLRWYSSGGALRGVGGRDVRQEFLELLVASRRLAPDLRFAERSAAGARWPPEAQDYGGE